MPLNNKPYLSDIIVYPVKSTAALSQSRTWVETQGIAFDRRFMVTREDGRMLTARDFPQLLNVTSTLFAEGLYLSYPQCERLILKYSDFSMIDNYTNVFKDHFTAYSTTKEANQWFSAILRVPSRLLYTGEQSSRTRSAIPYNISFADGYPLLILSEASLAALNERSVEQFSITHFRPNLVVRGTNAFDEDGWKRIRIGDVLFEGVKSCTRCILTTIDQQSGLFDSKLEPLNTLSEFRSDDQGNIKFGHNLVALNEGIIKTGDVVEVLEEKPREKFNIRLNQRSILICVKKEAIAHEFYTFWFESGNKKHLPSYFPGQHIQITVKIEGKYFTRRYTLSSTPSRPGSYAISIKRSLGGRVSSWMHDHFQVGQKLEFETPTGEFYIDNTAEKILLLAAGSGITPIISMLRYLYDNKNSMDIVLYYQCRTRKDIAFKSELDHFQTVNTNLKIILTLSQPDESWQGQKRRFDIETLGRIPDIIERKVFCCGPDQFMKNAQRNLLLLGLPESQYYQEAFGLASIPQSVFEPVKLIINGSAFAGNNQQPLLLQAEKAGISLPYGCRAGFCGRCKVRLISGQVDQSRVLSGHSGEQQCNHVLACCSVPLTDVEVVSEEP